MKGPRMLPRGEYSQYWQEAETLTGPQVALVEKSALASAGDTRDGGLIPRSGRSPGGEHSNAFQNSCVENPKDREARQATVHGVTQSQTRPKRLSTAPLFIRLPSCGSSTLNPMTFDLPPWPTLTPSSIIQPPPRVQRPQGTETQGPVSSAESAGAAQLQEGGRGRGGAQAWEHLWRQQISPLRY